MPVADRLGTVLLYLFASLPLLLYLVILTTLAPGRPESGDQRLLLDMGVGVAGLIVLGLRARWPVPVTLALILPTVFFFTVTGPALVAFASLATHRRWRQVVPVAVVFWLCTLASTRWQDGWALTLVFGAIGAAVLGVLTVVGLYLRGRREWAEAQRAAAVAAQEHRVEQAKLAERLKIAQEMHDVLAHRISLLTMLAGGLAYRKDLGPEEMRETALAIQDNAHQSLNELRAVLGTLRRDGGLEAPQPTLAHLEALFEEVRAAGQRVEVDDTVAGREHLPAQTGRHAYRIVQEALTNARKHAPGSPVRAELGGRPGAGLRIRVSNQAPAGDAAGPGGRLGLVGLAERTRMAGGMLDHGVRDGRFVLDALLPWEA
ncbi:histidine kinase [Nonomuraea maheshkhaliensis]|uniref:histidine kinase n=1 Tax=Nonomuraea maheshkhaliensis TaxID=419590 RepID=A0ABP4SPK3_9ACTN